MGHHYVPQRYLRNFEIQGHPGFIWLYDKAQQRIADVRIKSAAQSKNYYDIDVEKALADRVEGPGNAVIKLLCGQQPITDAERMDMTMYLGTMLMRVPRRRERALLLVPAVIERIRAEYSSTFDAAGRLAEMHSVLDRFSKELPEQVVRERIRAPWPTDQMLEAIYRMTWRVLRTDGPIFFLTTDNPLFFFDSYGLGTIEAEMAFPLSTVAALHGSFQRARETLVYLDVPQSHVKEINRRLSSAATRLAFYHEKVDWILPLLLKEHPHLTRIKW